MGHILWMFGYVLIAYFFWSAIIIIGDLAFGAIQKDSRIGRLIARERRWCWKRGGNWWRGGLPPE